MQLPMTRQQQLRGMTLIELTVALGIGLVIMGVIYLIYNHTSQTADRQRIEAQALMEAAQLSDRISGLIDNAIRPEGLRASAGESAPELFQDDLLAIHATTTNLSTTTSVAAGMALVSINHDETSQTVSISSDTVRPHQDLFITSIVFQYANTFDENFEPLDLTSETASRPKYIRYTITIRDKGELMREALTITSGAALK